MSVERFEALLTPQGRELLDYLAAEAVPADTTPAGTMPAGTTPADTTPGYPVPGYPVPADTALRLGTQLRARYPADLVGEIDHQEQHRRREIERLGHAG